MPFVTLAAVSCEGGLTQEFAVAVDAAGKAKVEWQPGDDIPGWEVYEYPCPVYSGGAASTVSLPDTWFTYLSMGDYAANIILSICVTAADCTDASCTTSINNDPGDAPHVFFTTTDWAVADIYEKTGYYGEGSGRDTTLTVTGGVPIGLFRSETSQRQLTTSVCVSRVRPDNLQGVVTVVYTSEGPLPHQYYDEVTVQYPFDVVFEDHAAWDFDIDGGDPSFEPLADRSINYSAPTDYDHAWNWAAITDAEIRAAVYDRYTPYNWP